MEDLILLKLKSLKVPFKRTGTNYIMTKCFNLRHSDTKPSFSINTETGFGMCFGCGFTIHKDFWIEGKLSEEQIKELEEEVFYMQLFKLLKKDKEDRKTIQNFLPPDSKEMLGNFRGLNRVIKEVGLYITRVGKYKDRVVMPFFEDETLIGYSCRALESLEPKYLHSFSLNVRELIYPFNLIKKSRTNWLVITEGAFDALGYWELNIPAMSNFGVMLNFSVNKISKLLSLGIDTLYLGFDKDKAGLEATKRFLESKKVNDNFEVFLLSDLDNVIVKNYLQSPYKDFSEYVEKKLKRG